jgi:hypothetical protein
MPTAMYAQTVAWGREGPGESLHKEGAKATLETLEHLIAHTGQLDSEGFLDPTNEPLLPDEMWLRGRQPAQRGKSSRFYASAGKQILHEILRMLIKRGRLLFGAKIEKETLVTPVEYGTGHTCMAPGKAGCTAILQGGVTISYKAKHSLIT